MKISTKGRYALSLVLCIARHGDGALVSLREVSETQGISMKYLEQLARSLTAANILHSVRGAKGGYGLSCSAEHTSVGDVLRASEGDLAPVSCLETDIDTICPKRSECETVAFWAGLDRVIEDYVDGVTIADLVGKTPSVRPVLAC